MPPKRKRQSIFDKHHDGQRIIKEIMSNKLSKTEGAKILGTSKSNITMYMKRHGLKVQDKPLSSKQPPLNLTKSSTKKKPPLKKKVAQLPQKELPDQPLNEMADQTIELTEDQLKYFSPTDIKELQQLLIEQIRSGEIKVDFKQFMSLSKEIGRWYALQLRYGLTEEQEEQNIKLDEKDVQAFLAQIEEEHCNTCPYRHRFNEQKNKETTDAQLAPG